MLLIFQHNTPLPPVAAIGPTIRPSGILYGQDAYVTVDGVDMGATVGPMSISWNVTHYYPSLNQARGPVEGTGRIIAGSFSIKVTMAEWQYNVLCLVCGSYGIASDANSMRFGGGELGAITELSNVVVTGVIRNDGRTFSAVLPHAYTVVGNIELNEDKETTLDVTFEGLHSALTPKILPGYITFTD